MKKRIWSLILVFCMLISFCSFSIVANATGRTVNEAMNWVRSTVGTTIDYDGYYGGQCVDLIAAFYNYLGVAVPGGNGCDYASNALPAGWSRVQGGAPQYGDILVYAGNSSNPYGHVAIYASDYEHYHQNFNGNQWVRQITSVRYNGLSNPYWGYIRPNYSGQASTVNITFGEPANETYRNKYSIGTTNAVLVTQVDISTGTLIGATEIGLYLYDSSNSYLTHKSEAPGFGNYSTGYMWYDINSELGYTLVSGRTYKYRFYVTLGGKTYYSDMYSFTTVHTHSYSSSVTTSPTCTAKGVRTYSCSCGNSYTESIAALSHSYGSWTTTKAATCTEDGVQRRTCSRCYNGETRAISKSGHTAVIDLAVVATCSSEGRTEGSHCSKCNAVIISQQIIPATNNHIDNNSDDRCDTCGKSLKPSNPSENCSCRCHKGGFQGFIYRVVRIFWIIFRINQTCQCGVNHY